MTGDTDPDRLFKRLWFINGIVLLLTLLVVLSAASMLWFGGRRGRSENIVAAPGKTGARDTRTIRFDVPVRIRGTDLMMILVRNGSGFQPGSSSEIPPLGAYGSDRSNGPIVNVIFMSPTDGEARLLFDRPAYISGVSYPALRGAGADSTQTWITYQAAFDDTNGDGELDGDDQRLLFVSDLDGRRLRPILPPGWWLSDFRPMGDRRSIAATALQASAAGQTNWDSRTAIEQGFIFDVITGELKSLSSIDSLVARAGKLLRKQ